MPENPQEPRDPKRDEELVQMVEESREKVRLATEIEKKARLRLQIEVHADFRGLQYKQKTTLDGNNLFDEEDPGAEIFFTIGTMKNIALLKIAEVYKNPEVQKNLRALQEQGYFEDKPAFYDLDQDPVEKMRNMIKQELAPIVSQQKNLESIGERWRQAAIGLFNLLQIIAKIEDLPVPIRIWTNDRYKYLENRGGELQPRDPNETFPEQDVPEPPPVQVLCDRCGWKGNEDQLQGNIGNCPQCGSSWEVSQLDPEAEMERDLQDAARMDEEDQQANQDRRDNLDRNPDINPQIKRLGGN